jgi:hypothetical protein
LTTNFCCFCTGEIVVIYNLFVIDLKAGPNITVKKVMAKEQDPAAEVRRKSFFFALREKKKTHSNYKLSPTTPSASRDCLLASHCSRLQVARTGTGEARQGEAKRVERIDFRSFFFSTISRRS